MMDLANHQVDGFRRRHDGHTHPVRRLRQFARSGIPPIPAAKAPVTTATATATAATLRAEITATAPTAATTTASSPRVTAVIAAVIAAVVATRFPPVVPTAPVVVIPTLAGSLVITGLR
jgi:hypothetical protein